MKRMFTKLTIKPDLKMAKVFLSAICLFVMLNQAEAQVGFPTAKQYPFKAKAKTYTYLSGGTSVNLQSDDRTVTNIPIGFTFTYCGTGYTKLSACSNGWMSLANSSSTQYTNSQGNAGSLAPLIMPLFDDLQGSGSVTTYKTVGATGSRVFIFEWKNIRPLSYTSNIFSMQAILYEATGAIEFMYKRESGGTNFSSATIGIMGKTSSDYQTLNNAGTNPTSSSTSFYTSVYTQAATGQSYFWGVDCPVKFPTQPQNVPSCAGATAIFTAAPDSASAYQWQWYGPTGWKDLGNDAIYSGVNSLNLSVKNTQLSWDKYRYRMVATNVEKNCSIESDEALLEMIPSSNSSIVIASSPGTEVCLNEEVVFTSAFTKGGSSPQYRWLLNGLEIPGATNASLQIDSLDHGDIVQCRFISSQQCVFESISNGIKIDVVSNLLAEVGIATSYNGGNSYTFIAEPTNGGDNPEFHWYVNNKLLPNETGQSFTTDILKPWDKVTVAMLSSRDCAMPRLATSRQATTSVASIDDNAGITLAPNPNTGKFTVHANGIGNNAANITVMNTVGKIVYRSGAQPVQGNLVYDIDMAGKAAAGVYILNIEVGGQQKMIKFNIVD
ncbi:MAG: T9SS type A sorting domain-containing protein [Chitinophagales bacterium]|nr:T9SS type A sorting domain-containing protein [Chitinophagales bacterium]